MSPLPISWAGGCVTTSLCSDDQRLHALRHEQPVRLVLDVPLRTLGWGKLHVPDLLERLLAELIGTLVWAHERTPHGFLVRWKM